MTCNCFGYRDKGHYFVWWGGEQLHDWNVPRGPRSKYGPNGFILASRKAKMEYMATAASYFYREIGLGEGDVMALVTTIFPDASLACVSREIDVGCRLYFPRPAGCLTEMADWWRWVRCTIIDNDNMVIMGGCDSRISELLEIARDWVMDFPFYSGGRFLCNHLEGSVTVCTPEEGRTRVLGPMRIQPKRSVVPELVELRVSDRCVREFMSSYWDSTCYGGDNGSFVLEKLAREIARAGVLEVALTGNYSVCYMGFIDLVRFFADSGVVPNFSCTSYFWVKDYELLEVVKGYCGAVALTTHDPEVARNWMVISRFLEVPNPGIHFEVDLCSLEVLKRMLDVAYEHFVGEGVLVLLSSHQGDRVEEGSVYHHGSEWMDVVEDSPAYEERLVALGGELASRAEGQLENVPARTIGNEGGRFSMFIDAVDMRYGPDCSIPRDEMGLIDVASLDSGWIVRAWEELGNA